jgi:hypothetical protein
MKGRKWRKVRPARSGTLSEGEEDRFRAVREAARLEDEVVEEDARHQDREPQSRELQSGTFSSA